MKALVTKNFYDKKNKKIVTKGTVIDVTVKRFNEIINILGAVLNLVDKKK